MTMRFGKMNKAVLIGSLSAVAALLLSTAAFAQDAGGSDPTTDQVVVQNWHDLNPAAGEGIAVGEPDPTGGTAANDGSASDGTASDGTGTGEVVIDDGTGVVEPDPTDGGTVVDDTGLDPTVDPGTDGDPGSASGDPEVTIYYMDGGPCIDCNMAGGVVPYGHSSNPLPFERTLVDRTPVEHKQTAKKHSPAAALASTTAMAQCLALHPRASWICEWQNGVGN